ncbi:MAG: thiamine-phosphate kinase [Fibrobacter sp.]|jgi:thiamine-monophosphate kinase|nr:thiamine-phosphate kinase [Fibrobacter sp.]
MKKKDFHFPPLGEFRLIEKILARNTPLAETGPESRFWIPAGDDAAAFDGWLATKDISVENTHFRLDWSSPEQAVRKAVVSNVSDISAMGGAPRSALLGLCLNRNWSEDIQSRIADAFSEELAKRNITVLGGDTVAGDTGMFSVTLIGSAARVLRRRGAKPGDFVYLTGAIGRSRAGLWLLEHGKAEAFPELSGFHLSPEIHEGMGEWISRFGEARACIDVSDGLSSELHHLALSSGVRIEVEEEKIPVASGVGDFLKKEGFPAFDFVFNSGEEYQLLFTSPLSESIFCKMQNSFPITCIGTVSEGSGVLLRGRNGVTQNLEAKAWSHL